MALDTNNSDILNELLVQLEGLQVARSSIEPPLRAALAGDLPQMFTWARAQGAEHARSGGSVQALVDRLMKVAELMPASISARARPEGLSAALISSAVEGYVAARDSSPDRLVREVDLTALHRVISAANSSLKLTDMLKEIVQSVVAVTHADVCSIFLYEPEWDQLVLTATSGLNQDEVGKTRLRLGEGITGWAALIGKPVPVLEAWSDSRFKYVPQLHEEKTVSILAVPIVLFTKEKLVGVIDVHTFDRRSFSDNEVKFLETVAGEIAIAIENARLYEQTDSELRQKVTELTTLQGVSAHIASTLNLTEVLALIAHQAAHLVRADAAAIYELHSELGVLEMVAQYDLQHHGTSIYNWRSEPRTVLPVEQSAIAHAVMRGIPVAMPPDADAGLGLPFASEGYLSMYCIPLVAPRGIMGGICLYNCEAKTYSDDQVRLLDAFAREAAIALENSRLYDAALRGLQTKSAMLQEMNHRVRNNLQTVAGLLSMQLRRMSPDGDGAVAVRESISRVQSIAAVHDLMMSSEGEIDSISIYDLARKVADAVVSTLVKPGFRLKLDVEQKEAERIRVGSHEATLLALLFNELVSNAILHGFVGLESGQISIRVHQEMLREEPEFAEKRASSLIRIEVEDTGIGLPPGFDPQKNANLGLNIVRTLVVSDLRGSFAIEPRKRGHGTRAVFSFMPSV